MKRSAPPSSKTPGISPQAWPRQNYRYDNNDSQYPRRQTLGSVSKRMTAAIPVKTARVSQPQDESVSVGRRVTSLARRGDETATYQNITDKIYAYSNQSIREGPAPRQMAARKSEVTELSSDEEESSEPESSEEEEEETEDEAQSAAAQSDAEEDADEEPGQLPLPARPPVIEILDDTPPASPIKAPQNLTPPSKILAAIELSVLPLVYVQDLKRLPFLRRNLRRGFLRYCHKQKIPTQRPPPPFPRVSVVLRLADSDQSYETTISSFECPLCRLYRPFETKEMLQVHLDKGHSDVEICWKVDADQGWEVELLLLPMKKEDCNLLSDSLSPPDNNPFEPEARYPFLPAKSEWDGPDITYSARPGGPKLYDLLGLLPLEPYGVLAWTVLEREEEIFESDEIPDTHKVMHALWARWIHTNRNVFLAGCCKGFEKFIDEYWRMMRLAAGLDALRTWLLMLMATRFLKAKEVAHLIRYYSNKS
ncbi:hypothetical protein C8F01DRAFT_1103861, partial [Mycena amicta]